LKLEEVDVFFYPYLLSIPPPRNTQPFLFVAKQHIEKKRTEYCKKNITSRRSVEPEEEKKEQNIKTNSPVSPRLGGRESLCAVNYRLIDH